MTRIKLIRHHNKLHKALDALIELSGDKYRQAINDLRTDIADIDDKLYENANQTNR